MGKFFFIIHTRTDLAEIWNEYITNTFYPGKVRIFRKFRKIKRYNGSPNRGQKLSREFGL